MLTLDAHSAAKKTSFVAGEILLVCSATILPNYRWLYPADAFDINFLRLLPVRQQPKWESPEQLLEATEELTCMPPLVEWEEVATLRLLLGDVVAGKAQVLQAGDCAEDPAECTLGHITRKAALLDVLSGAMKLNTRKPVVRVGRIAGQFAKPRSLPTEIIDDQELPVFRGHIVNSPEPVLRLRRHLPTRLIAGYRAARAAHDILRHRQLTGGHAPEAPIWTSHEALLLDYELPMLRRDSAGQIVLTSTHWPWIGDRTRQVDEAHVAMLAMISNPVACKIGPTTAVEELIALCAQLDPDREPGRLTLISRMGADAVDVVLPPLVEAVRDAGHPVIWLCDPMHGNTVKTPSGRKTRCMDVMLSEIRGFQSVVDQMGGVVGGLHLETTPDQVTECVTDLSGSGDLSDSYTSLCDPRLNPDQAFALASNWRSS